MKRPVKKTDGAHNHKWFFFSDNILDWMGSTVMEKKRETSHRHYILKRAK